MFTLNIIFLSLLTYTETQRVFRWRIYIEEYHPTFHYVKGTDNAIADSISRLPRLESLVEDDIDIGPKSPTSTSTSTFSIELDDEPLLTCFLNHPILTDNIQYPLDYNLIHDRQLLDIQLILNQQTHPLKFPSINFHDIFLICFVKNPGDTWRIAIPTSLLDPIINWYHQMLAHVGMTRLNATIATHFYHPTLKARVEHIVRVCEACQRTKLPGTGFGELPPRNALLLPWSEVAVDLIGPWKITVAAQTIEFRALTCIDTVTNLAEISRIINKTSEYIAMKFENDWLARYPRPERCIHDNGGEFTGAPFLHMLVLNGIKDVTTTVKNPQANAICERFHQSISNSLRVMLKAHPPINEFQAQNIVDTCFAAASYAARATIHSILRISPGAWVFQRDMILNIPLITDLQLIHQRRQVIIDERLRRANFRRRSYDYKVGDEILILLDNPTTLDDRGRGPYTIIQVHANGTVTFQRTMHITERINIRRIKPFHR